MTDKEGESTGKNFLTVLNSVYGPYAFGLTAVLIIWFGIVRPELQTRQIDHDANVEVLKQLTQAYNDQLVVARTMERTVESLGTTVQILDRIMEKRDDSN